jgi:hypothetical protein
VGIACSIVVVQVNLSFGKWNISVYSSHIVTIDALSSLLKWSNLSWLRKLVSLQSLLATAEKAKVNEPSPSSRLARSTQGGSTVWSLSVAFIILVIQTPFSPLVNAETRYTPGNISFLASRPRPL